MHVHSKSWDREIYFWMQHHCCPQGKEHPPVLLVDGYNVLYKFVESLQVSRSSHPIAIAKTFEDRRQAFELSINAYSHTQGVKVVIAYDAINRPADPVYVDIRTSSRYVKRSVRLFSLLQKVAALQSPTLPGQQRYANATAESRRR